MSSNILKSKKKFFLIIYSLGQQSGYGHYKRAQIIERYLKENVECNVKKMCIQDNEIFQNNIAEVILKKINKKKIEILILDLNYLHIQSTIRIKKMLIKINSAGVKLIGVDSLRNFYKYLDCVWIPSPFKKNNLISKKIVWGWDKMIFHRYNLAIKKKNNNILFLVGSGKNALLSNRLPKLVEKQIPKEFNLYWVSGKFSDKPKFVDQNRWSFFRNPHNLKELFCKSSFVFSLYGLSFFESLSCGIPTVSFCSKNNYNKDYDEIKFLKKKKIYFIENNLSKAVDKLVKLISSKNLEKKFKKNAKQNLEYYDFSFLKKV